MHVVGIEIREHLFDLLQIVAVFVEAALAVVVEPADGDEQFGEDQPRRHEISAGAFFQLLFDPAEKELHRRTLLRHQHQVAFETED